MNQPFRFLQDHWQAATAIAEQRLLAMGAEEARVGTLLEMERLLRVHVHVLGQCAKDLPGAQSEFDHFVRWAALFGDTDPAVRAMHRADAANALAVDGSKADGAFQALALFPSADGHDALAAVYQDHPDRRARLFRLWRICGQAVPQALIHQAVLHDHDEGLQQAALAYAAGRPDIGIDLFERFYGISRTPSGDNGQKALLGTALWGGMSRGDERARVALRHAIESESSEARRGVLLMLAALSGEPTLVPILVTHFRQSPNQGGMPLAIHGSDEAIEALVDAMAYATTMQAAARVWPWVAGAPAPLRPRLVLSGSAPDLPHAGTRPDVDQVRERWAAIRADAQDSEQRRFVFGRPMSRQWLMALCRVRAGTAGGYLMDLLAMSLGRPLGIHPSGWHHARMAVLDRLESASMDKEEGGWN